MTYLLEIDNLGKRYDDFELSGVSLAVEPGCVVGFIGSNGAGKTTTIKAALGIIAADGGAVRLFGQPIACGSPELDTIKSRIGVVLDTCAFPDTCRVCDVGAIGRAAYAEWDAAQFAALCDRFNLAPKKKVSELSRGMGVEISPVTNGPVVDESLQTSIPGVFAAGNVLHVHDLVDYVSEEAAAAGRAAVRYLAQGETGERHEIPITFEGGIRYTVPASIDPKLVQDDLLLRFRVGGVMKKRVVKLYLSDEAVVSRKRPVMAPGEMEELKLTKDMLAAHPGLSRIHITVEEA